MDNNRPISFEILDIIKLNRKQYKHHTVNKFCQVISCRISGKSDFFFDGKKITVKRGDIIFIPSMACYSQITQGEEIICFHIHSNGCFFQELHKFTPSNPDKICDLFKEAYGIWKDKNKQFSFYSMAILYQILANTDYRDETQSKHYPQMIYEAMKYLDANICNKGLKLDNVFRKSHISRAYFNRIFKAEYHCTPISYVNKKRIDFAKSLLKIGGYTRTEISDLCGFTDVKYFYVVFKRVQGETVGEYLNRMDN